MNLVALTVAVIGTACIQSKGSRCGCSCLSSPFQPCIGRPRGLWWSTLATLLLLAILSPQRSAAQIAVQPNTEGNTQGSCSLQEAIYATEFRANIALDQTDPDHTYSTGCFDNSTSWNTIDLPGGTLTFTKSWDGDAHNPFGPTATPIIFSTITIRGHGTTLQWTGPENYRLFAIGQASITLGPQGGVLTSGAYSGTGNLTLQDVYVKGFQAKGGDGFTCPSCLEGSGGGGGGLGAGGAIYLGKVGSGVPALTVVNSTFEQNGAIGGNGVFGIWSGGGGMGGGGGYGNVYGGGGGGSRGNGGTFGDPDEGTGGGGGTVFDGGNGGAFGGSGGYLCGGAGGDGGHIDGYDATCPGGGGGGGVFRNATDFSPEHAGKGGNGAYGGGGGGGADDAGNGGFGGGGGSADNTSTCDPCGAGGNGGFGGGGGASNGSPGAFGGRADDIDGGGGGALGGAIFNDSGTVVVQNSTFFNNSVTRGASGGGNADNGGDSGGAIFSRNGSLTVQNATISNNQATGAGGGIVVYKDSDPTFFILDNTIIANNGAQECIADAGILTSNGPAKSANNLIVNNSGCPKATVMSDPKLDTQPKPNSPPGDTPTIALLPGSPAIDAGDDTTALGTDQRGVTRPQGAASDIGAFERVPQADLSLSKTVGSSTAKAGDTVTYTLTLTNNGPDTANSITVTDNFPSALTFVSCSAPGGSCGTGSATSVTYTSLAASSSATITITGTLNSGYARGTVIENDASVADTSPDDPDSTNNSSSSSFKVIVPDFSVSAVSPITVPIGGSGTSSVTIGSIDTFSSAVALTSSGPAGLDNSVSPSSVTPPSNSSASSTLTISLEPSVVPGTYNVTVTGTSGALIHATTVTANVQATIGGTITVINTDQALGCIDNSGISGALQSKLSAALADIAAGKVQAAINTLSALLNQLQAQAGKHISTSCKDGSGNAFNPDAVLIADVKAILAGLGVNVAADPIMGSVVNSSGVGISGLTVTLLNSAKAVVSSATTDVTGFFYFPLTSGLTPGANYTNKVVIVKPYKNSTPSSQSFTWGASTLLLKNFVIN